MKNQRMDSTGQKYGRLTFLEPTGETNIHRNALWKLRCDCGKIVILPGTDVRRGNTKSCGCLFKEIDRKIPLKHGLTMGKARLRLYNIWSAMKERCSNRANENYHRYGGRGITVCQEWLEFLPFHNWAMSNGYQTTLTIERINNDGNYEPSNCKWATHKEQGKNTSRNHCITFREETKTVGEWADILGLRPNALLMRIRNGWPIEKALTLPLLNNRTRIPYLK